MNILAASRSGQDRPPAPVIPGHGEVLAGSPLAEAVSRQVAGVALHEVVEQYGADQAAANVKNGIGSYVLAAPLLPPPLPGQNTAEHLRNVRNAVPLN